VSYIPILRLVVTFTFNINVINCQSRRVVPAPPNRRYLCLSYVWGLSATSSTSAGQAEFPRTISDAIVVTLMLGYEFLWVNRYCINQNDPKEKHNQILQIDKIYRNAQACIVAAAGKDPNHGLPGVSLPRHRSKPVCRLDGMTVTLFRDDGSLLHDIGKSRWAERGWTFQEILFSRRRLYFTDTRCYTNAVVNVTVRSGFRLSPVLLRWKLQSSAYSGLQHRSQHRPQRGSKVSIHLRRTKCHHIMCWTSLMLTSGAN